MRENLQAGILLAFVIVLAEFMCNKIYQVGFIAGKTARNKELDRIAHKRVLSKVISFPFEKSHATDSTTKPETNT